VQIDRRRARSVKRDVGTHLRPIDFERVSPTLPAVARARRRSRQQDYLAAAPRRGRRRPTESRTRAGRLSRATANEKFIIDLATGPRFSRIPHREGNMRTPQSLDWRATSAKHTTSRRASRTRAALQPACGVRAGAQPPVSRRPAAPTFLFLVQRRFEILPWTFPSFDSCGAAILVASLVPEVTQRTFFKSPPPQVCVAGGKEPDGMIATG